LSLKKGFVSGFNKGSEVRSETIPALSEKTDIVMADQTVGHPAIITLAHEQSA